MKSGLIIALIIGLIIGLIFGLLLSTDNTNTNNSVTENKEIVSKVALGFEPWDTLDVTSVEFNIEDDGYGTTRTDMTDCLNHLRQNYESPAGIP